MAYRLLHKKSSLPGKTPLPGQLEYGELAINYNAESPTLYIKDSNNNIQSFSNTSNIDISIKNKQNVPIVISYEDLLSLTTNNQLVVGQKYRINDYVTTTNQSETSAATHPFDIIVEAISTDTLNENAQAAQSDNDNGYFDGNKLESWEIKYCIYNDDTRFAWADKVNGKGVIYYMKDEFKNEAWYDFKNILFLRTKSWFQSNPQFFISFNKDTYFYTFSRVEGDNSIKDDTLYTSNYHAINNSLGKNDAKKTKLNNTIFIDKPNKGAFNNVIADGHKDNTFGYCIWNNNIGYQFSGNTIYEIFQYNNIQSKCCDNKISKSFKNNNAQNNFSHNTILGSFTHNNVKNDCFSNEFMSDVLSCNFNQAYQYNHCDEYKYITIGNTKIQVIGDKITYNGSDYNVVNNHVIVINGTEYEVISKPLSYCTFGDNNNWISDMIPMTNVTIGNCCFSGNNDNKVFLNNLYTKENKKLLDAIKEFDNAYEYTIMSCSNNTYDIFSHDVVNKISNIYDMGVFNSSGDAEHKAKQGGIATNKNINYLKYLTADNKTGLIEQLVGDTETIQILSWNGVRYYRILQFSYFNGYPTSINNPSWEKLKLVSEKEWDATQFHSFNPLLSDPNLDFTASGNNIDCYGYVGTLKNINLKGDNIFIDSIGVYVREGRESPNPTVKVWCRLLKFVNEQWKIIYQSETSQSIQGIAPETLFTFKMVKKDADALIKCDDKIAITYVNAENADVLSGVQLGFKSVDKPGFLHSILSNNSTGDNTYAPAFVIGYLPTATKNHETINISQGDDVKTVISNDIDGGELKVLHNNSRKGFIIRTKNSDADVLPLEILTTDGYNSSYQYNFPTSTGGNVAIGAKIGNTTYDVDKSTGLIDLSGAITGSVSVDLSEIEDSIENLNESLGEVNAKIDEKINDGKLIVFQEESTKGFSIQSKKTTDSFAPLEISSINGVLSRTFTFPQNGGTIPIGVTVNRVKYTTNSSNGFIDITSAFQLYQTQIDNLKNEIETLKEQLLQYKNLDKRLSLIEAHTPINAFVENNELSIDGVVSNQMINVDGIVNDNLLTIEDFVIITSNMLESENNE